jgi:hypothetical protein
LFRENRGGYFITDFIRNSRYGCSLRHGLFTP